MQAYFDALDEKPPALTIQKWAQLLRDYGYELYNGHGYTKIRGATRIEFTSLEEDEKEPVPDKKPVIDADDHLANLILEYVGVHDYGAGIYPPSMYESIIKADSCLTKPAISIKTTELIEKNLIEWYENNIRRVNKKRVEPDITETKV